MHKQFSYSNNFRANILDAPDAPIPTNYCTAQRVSRFLYYRLRFLFKKCISNHIIYYIWVELKKVIYLVFISYIDYGLFQFENIQSLNPCILFLDISENVLLYIPNSPCYTFTFLMFYYICISSPTNFVPIFVGLNNIHVLQKIMVIYHVFRSKCNWHKIYGYFSIQFISIILQLLSKVIHFKPNIIPNRYSIGFYLYFSVYIYIYILSTTVIWYRLDKTPGL
jgi:hypothetical protein